MDLFSLQWTQMLTSSTWPRCPCHWLWNRLWQRLLARQKQVIITLMFSIENFYLLCIIIIAGVQAGVTKVSSKWLVTNAINAVLLQLQVIHLFKLHRFTFCYFSFFIYVLLDSINIIAIKTKKQKKAFISISILIIYSPNNILHLFFSGI
jgi:hypothetical protein